MPGSEFLGLHATVGGRFGEAKPQVRFALVAGIVSVDRLPCRIRGIQFCIGIGFSNGMFPASPGRARPLGADLLGSFGGVLAWPIACWAAATPPPDLRIAWTSGKPARFVTRHRARPASGAAPPRSPGGRAAIRPPAQNLRAPAPTAVPGPPPRCLRIRSITGASRMAAMILISPPQFGQCLRSISKAKLQRRLTCTQVMS